MSLVLYFLLLLILTLSLPTPYLEPQTQQFIFVLGAVGIWRYSWGGVHFVRSLIYRKIVFPRWRRKADAVDANQMPARVFFLITSYRIPTEISIEVYRAAIKEAIRLDLPVTLVASIVENRDEQLIRAIFRVLTPPEQIHLYIVRRPGTGKRDALASGFSAISRLGTTSSDVVAVIDGDSILTPNSIKCCLPFFSLWPDMGALTTDEDCRLLGSSKVTAWYRCWYHMRFAQRHIAMSSMGLARRVLTLTGRMSIFRARIVIEPEFIQTVQHDYIDHWRLGRFKFLTGDDKSSWYYLLKNHWQMFYIPDVQIITIEEPPHDNFFAGATMLMMRWFGNMLRTNQRARALPRRTTGTFVWWCLIDQRLSMWTSLFGLTGALLGTALYGVEILLIYTCWILFTRFIQTLMLRSARPQVSAFYPFFLYFNQIYGSVIKIYILSHLNRQKWTRQKTTLKFDQSALQLYVQRQFSNLTLATSVLVLVGLISFLVGLYDGSDLRAFVGAFN